MIENYYSPDALETKAKLLFANERAIKRLDGWFIVKEIYERVARERKDELQALRAAHALYAAVEKLPIYIDEHAVFAGTQRDSFARSYALINPSFTVASFNGYCDPTAVFNDIEPDAEFPRERIETVRQQTLASEYVAALSRVYEKASQDIAEVAYFIEQVSGHLIPDMRTALAEGVLFLKRSIQEKLNGQLDDEQKVQYQAMLLTLDSVLLLADRYRACAEEMLQSAVSPRKEQLQLMVDTLEKVPAGGSDTLYEAIQSYLLLWQVMCLEQAPNPFAFSVGNADRIFEPYRIKEGLSREYAAGLFKHFLVFYNVGDRSWAISQNVLIGGKDIDGHDLTNESSYALLDAYYAMNLPQPILSVKVHANTPDRLYEELGRFFFTPGALTPSLFNDDSLFPILNNQGVDREDLPDYAVAGCQEPLIMGKDNGNTTNSWLNLAKILEFALNDGKSNLSGKQLGPTWRELSKTGQPLNLANIRDVFYTYLDCYLDRMVENANGASRAISLLPVPFLSCLMGGIETGIDTRDAGRQGTRYNGSGCLIHGLTVVAESFVAIDCLLKERPQDGSRLNSALATNFEHDQDLAQYLMRCPKFGNNDQTVDEETVSLATKVSEMVRARQNYLGNPFRPDYSTPSTHLLYGALVGALPNGRKAKEMLNYGVDPLYGEATTGLGYRTLSTKKLCFEQFNGGYASHLGLDPNYFRGRNSREKGLEFKTKIMSPLFFSPEKGRTAPFYLYVNITTPDILRSVLADPKKYAPSGVYIMRIHGTFVNFLDLSPEIQEDIILRLDLNSTNC